MPATSSCKNQQAKKSQQRNERVIKRRQPTRIKRIRKGILCVGTWNIMTMLQAGKMNEIADEMLKTQLQIVTLQELRMPETSIVKKIYKWKHSQEDQ